MGGLREQVQRIAKKAKTHNRSPMKCLAIRQAWATLIAAGIKDVECSDKLVPPCKRFLIAAGRDRHFGYFPYKSRGLIRKTD